MSMPETIADGVPGLLDGYRPPAGVADELLDAGGGLRPVWRPLIDYLAAHTATDILDDILI